MKKAIYVVLIILLLNNVLGDTILKSGECKDFILLNNSTEKVCSTEISDVKVVCPGINLTIPACPTLPNIPECPKSPDNICNPSFNVTSQAFTAGAEFYKDAKNNKPMALGVAGLITLSGLAFIFKDNLFSRKSSADSQITQTYRKNDDYPLEPIKKENPREIPEIDKMPEQDIFNELMMGRKEKDAAN